MSHLVSFVVISIDSNIDSNIDGNIDYKLVFNMEMMIDMLNRNLIRCSNRETFAAMLEHAKSFIRIEATALTELAERLTNELCDAASEILDVRGKVVISGVGKSQLIGEKISATLASTGTPSHTLDPTDAMHGDLGRIGSDDILIALSNSGETLELMHVVNSAKCIPVKVISITGNAKSTLANLSDVVLDIGKVEEACPLGLAPTTSTTVMMALGDALALVLLEQRGFTHEDFARLHPAGALGKKLQRSKNAKDCSGDMQPLMRSAAS